MPLTPEDRAAAREARECEFHERVGRVRPGVGTGVHDKYKGIGRVFENAILNRVDRHRRESVRAILAEVEEDDPIRAILKSRGRQGGRTLFERLCAAGRMRPRELRGIVRDVQRELRAAELAAKRG